MIWSSDRAGYRSHGSWGAEDDIYIMFFDGEAYDKFRLTKEEQALLDEEKEDKDKDEKDKDSKKDKDKDDDKKDEKADKPVEPLKFDLANRKDRIMRLTVNSSFLGDAVLTQKGDQAILLRRIRKRLRPMGTQFQGEHHQTTDQRCRWWNDVPRQERRKHFPRFGRPVEEDRNQGQQNETDRIQSRIFISPGERTRIYIPSHLAPSIRQVLRSPNTWYQLGRIWKGIRKISSAYQQ